MKISYAQNYEDILIDRLFMGKSSGFYIDVGAAHPIKDSVSKYFYEKGWSGINIEPNEEFCQLLKKDRPRDINLWCALADHKGEMDYFFAPSDPKISFSGDSQDTQSRAYRGLELQKKRVTVRTLTDVCAEFKNGAIDFLKIDVEGAEEKVLKGIDFEVISPKLILIESVAVKGAELVDRDWIHYLTDAGYERCYFDGINSYFVKSDDLKAKEAYRIPLNAADNFVKYEYTRPKFLFKRLFSSR